MVGVLSGLDGGAFSKIVEGREDVQAASRFVQGESDVAKIRVRDVLQLRQRAGRPDTNHRAAGVELAIERLDVGGGLRFAERNADGRKNAARARQQERLKNNPRLA